MDGVAGIFHVVLCAEARYNRRKGYGFAKGDNIMNENHLHQIFENYINRFEEFNSTDRNEISEYYKWEIAAQFRGKMDDALNSKKEEFAKALYEVEKVTRDLADNYVQPFYGLVQLAHKQPETVKSMFQKLYADAGKDLNPQGKIEEFLGDAEQLVNLYYPNSYLYKNSFHSATIYLAMYDPEHNYIYKPYAARKFAKYADFGDDFGSGIHVKLNNYYRMCNELVKAINEYPRLKELEKIRSRQAGEKTSGEKLYKDDSQHILAYDIIYCAYKYNLFDGITLKTLTAKELKEQKLIEEKQQKALELLEKLKNAQEQKKVLDAAMEKVEQYFNVGQKVAYKSFGKAAQTAIGTIVKRGNDSVTIDFGDGNVKSVGLIIPIVNGYIRPQEADENDYANIVAILKKKSVIENNLSQIGKDFAPYSDYI